jgi:hypothetical protein
MNIKTSLLLSLTKESRFLVLTAILINTQVFWHMGQCRLAISYHTFRRSALPQTSWSSSQVLEMLVSHNTMNKIIIRTME